MTRFAFAFVASLFVQDLVRSVADDAPPPPPAPTLSDVEVKIQLAPNVTGRLQQIQGTTNAKGVPIVLLKSDKDSEPWWVQGAPIRSKDQFAAQAVFGNDRTTPGARFRVCVIVVEPNANYRTGQVLKELPDIPKSDDLIVTLVGLGRYVSGKETGKDDKRPIELTSPLVNSSVEQVAQIRGKVTKSVRPVILIRPLEDDSLWWIQDEVEVTRTETFSLNVAIGDNDTPDGTRFRIIALAVPKASRAEFKPGESLKDLPAGIETSREIIVSLRRQTQTANKTEATR